MDGEKNDKIERVLAIYNSLINGEVINKAEAAKKYGVNERSIQRDLDDIRSFLDVNSDQVGYLNSVIYDRSRKGYRLDHIYNLKLTNPEVLAACKIILDSRAFTKKEMNSMIERLVSCCVPKENQKLVMDLVRNELFHYIPPHHNSEFLDKMWTIGQAIREHRIIEVEYQRISDGERKERRLEPLAICFSDFYFYLVAYIEFPQENGTYRCKEATYPTIFRIDRIKSLLVKSERYVQPYANRFEEGEFRKRIQFMYGGELEQIEFKYKGVSLEAVLDRLPTAVVIKEDNGTYTIRAEVFGDGIDMWLRSQGDSIEVISQEKVTGMNIMKKHY